MIFPISLKMDVDWGEMDAYGHVNNTVYFKYFESVRMKYMEKIGAIDLMQKENIGPILAATSCKFKMPLIYPCEIEVFAGVKSIGNTSLVMEYKIEMDNKMVAAFGDSVIVIHDYTSKSNVSVPSTIIENIEALEQRKVK